MADVLTTDPPASGRLFSGIKFWVGHQIPQRSWLVQNMRLNGAQIVPLEKQADMCLVDHAKKVLLPVGDGCFSYRFVEDSIRKGSLEDPEQHRVGITSRVQRPVGSMAYAGKRTKTIFTEADDQILYNWIVPFRDAGGKWKGNAVYQQIEGKHPHHTYQSWRSRFVDIVQYQLRTITKPPPWDAGQDQEDLLPQRSPKRRRLNGTGNDGSNDEARRRTPVQPVRPGNTTGPTLRTDAEATRPPSFEQQPPGPGDRQEAEENDARQAKVAVPDPDQNLNAPMSDEERQEIRRSLRQKLKVDSTLKERIKVLGFDTEQAKNMYVAVPDILNTKPEVLGDSWKGVAKERPPHTAWEWSRFYETLILPVYLERNKLTEQDEIQEHIERLLENEARHIQSVLDRRRKPITPEVKIEPAQGLRSSADKQRDKEPARARVESEEIEMSPVSDAGQKSTLDDLEDEDHVPAVLSDPSSVLEPTSPKMKGGTAQANEGRKQASLQSTTTESTSQQSQQISPSQASAKKKLFGRALNTQSLASQHSEIVSTFATRLSAEQLGGPNLSLDPAVDSSAPSSEDDQVKKVAGTDLQTQTLATSSGDPSQQATWVPYFDSIMDSTNPVKTIFRPTVQVRTSQEPPESGQRLPKSSSTTQSTSQPSGRINSTAQGQIAGTKSLNPSVSQKEPSIVDMRQQSLVGIEDVRIDLLGQGLEEEDGLQSEHAPSDTGSEFMVFDAAPERSQLWAVPDDEEPVSTADSRQRAVQRRPPTPVRRQPSPDDHEEETDRSKYSYETEDSPPSPPFVKRAAGPVETQTLFQMSLKHNLSAFDVPAPEGGWEELGIDDVDDEQLDTILETTELSVETDDEDVDEYVELAKERVSSASSERMTSSVSKHSRGQASHAEATTALRQPIVISSASSSETELTASGIDVQPQQHRMQPQTSPYPQSPEFTTSETESATHSDSDLESSPRTVTNSQNSDIQTWFRSQRGHHSTLSNPIFHRLASTAAQATTLNLSAAALVLRIMADRFTASEANRCAQNKAFRPRKTLSVEEARRLVPDDDWGVWTIEDDRNLLSMSTGGVRKVEAKHGIDGARRRSRFLRARYRVDEKETDGVGREVAREVLMASDTKIKAEAR